MFVSSGPVSSATLLSIDELVVGFIIALNKPDIEYNIKHTILVFMYSLRLGSA